MSDGVYASSESKRRTTSSTGAVDRGDAGLRISRGPQHGRDSPRRLKQQPPASTRRPPCGPVVARPGPGFRGRGGGLMSTGWAERRPSASHVSPTRLSTSASIRRHCLLDPQHHLVSYSPTAWSSHCSGTPRPHHRYQRSLRRGCCRGHVSAIVPGPGPSLAKTSSSFWSPRCRGRSNLVRRHEQHASPLVAYHSKAVRGRQDRGASPLSTVGIRCAVWPRSAGRLRSAEPSSSPSRARLLVCQHVLVVEFAELLELLIRLMGHSPRRGRLGRRAGLSRGSRLRLTLLPAVALPWRRGASWPPRRPSRPRRVVCAGVCLLPSSSPPRHGATIYSRGASMTTPGPHSPAPRHRRDG